MARQPSQGLRLCQSLTAVCLTSPSVFLFISRTQIGKDIPTDAELQECTHSQQSGGQQEGLQPKGPCHSLGLLWRPHSAEHSPDQALEGRCA